MSSYAEFLAAREQLPDAGGFAPMELPSHLFDFQALIVEWAVRQGRAGIFADCGLGKTPMSLAWAEQVHTHTGKPVLLLTPLAVGQQIVAEAAKFGHDAAISRNGTVAASITVTNYEQLDKFDPAAFSGVVCDESSILKSFDGATKAAVTEFMRRIQYRLLATATAAPNDYTELGTSSEALGGLGYMDMLTRFFINKDRKQSSRGGRVMRWEMSDRVGLDRPGTWRLKGHAEDAFWRWVATWARAIRKPSDYGFSDEHHRLPELIERTRVIEPRTVEDGHLFDVPSYQLHEERAEQRRTLKQFTDGNAKWVLTVYKISEGVDVPRLQVLVYATVTRTRLFFIQAVGRVIRVVRELSRAIDQTAWVYIPDDEHMRTYAADIEDQQALAEIAKLDEDEYGADEDALFSREYVCGERGDPRDKFVSAEAAFSGTTAAGEFHDAELAALAREMGGPPTQTLSLLAKLRDRGMLNLDSPAPPPPPTSDPAAKLQARIQDKTAAVNAWAGQRLKNGDFSAFRDAVRSCHKELGQMFGVWQSNKNVTVTQVEKATTYAREQTKFLRGSRG